MLLILWAGLAAYFAFGVIAIGPLEGCAMALFPGLLLLRHTITAHRIALEDRQFHQRRELLLLEQQRQTQPPKRQRPKSVKILEPGDFRSDSESR